MTLKRLRVVWGIFLLAGGVFAAMSFIPLMADSVSGAKDRKATLQRVILKVGNLSCSGCFTTMNQALSPLEGFSGMATNLLRKRVGVDFDSPMTAERVAAVISDLGYPATIESVTSVDESASFVYMEYRRGGCGSGISNGGCGSSGPACSSGDPSIQYGQNGSCCSQPDSPKPKTIL